MLKCTPLPLPCSTHENLSWCVSRQRGRASGGEVNGSPAGEEELQASSPIGWADHWMPNHSGFFSLHFAQLRAPSFALGPSYIPHLHLPCLPPNLSTFFRDLPKFSVGTCPLCSWSFLGSFLPHGIITHMWDFSL